MGWIFETYPSLSFVFLRLGLAVVFFAHSTQQIFGWYGGRGLKGMLAKLEGEVCNSYPHWDSRDGDRISR